jgi:hypothetical protein
LDAVITETLVAAATCAMVTFSGIWTVHLPLNLTLNYPTSQGQSIHRR